MVPIKCQRNDGQKLARRDSKHLVCFIMNKSHPKVINVHS